MKIKQLLEKLQNIKNQHFHRKSVASQYERCHLTGTTINSTGESKYNMNMNKVCNIYLNLNNEKINLNEFMDMVKKSIN